MGDHNAGRQMTYLRKLTTGRRHMNAEQRAECIRLYLDGATLDALAERYDRNRTIIDRLMGRAGVRRGHKFRPKGIRYGGRQKRDRYLEVLREGSEGHSAGGDRLHEPSR
jgi:transposase-like protein